LKKNGVEFLPNTSVKSGQNMSKSSASSSSSYSDAKKEEGDLAKAIAASLKETSARPKVQQAANANASNSLYGSLLSNVKTGTSNSNLNASSSSSSLQNNKKRKVKALYDFEAVEENEISFKAGDLLFVTDESDQNWWKGIDTDGDEGLFPSNFVTADLDEKIESFTNSNDSASSNSKKVSFNESVNVKVVETTNNANNQNPRQKQIYIDEKKIDDCLELLQNADPTGEIQPDTPELLELEDQCYMMGPLIDKQLQHIDYKHVILEDLNLKMLEAFQIYNNLMKESISKSNMGFVNGMGVAGAGTGPGAGYSIPYAAAPPHSSLDQSSLLLANQLSNIALSNQQNNFSAQMMPPQYNAVANNFQSYSNPNPDPAAFQFQAQNQNQYAAPSFPIAGNNFPNQGNLDNGILSVPGTATNQSGLANPSFYK
jgi:hypothetical protein